MGFTRAATLPSMRGMALLLPPVLLVAALMLLAVALASLVPRLSAGRAPSLR